MNEKQTASCFRKFMRLQVDIPERTRILRLFIIVVFKINYFNGDGPTQTTLLLE